MRKKLYEINQLRTILKKVLVNIKTNKIIQNDIISALINTSLRGIDSHGVNQIFNILKRFNQKRTQVKKCAKIIKNNKSNALIVIDALMTPGQHSTFLATREVAIKAKKFGIAIAVVKNSTHFGSCVPYLVHLTKQKLIGFVGSNSVMSMVAFGSKTPNLGNNPFGFGAPSSDEKDFIFDFSSGVMSFSKLNDFIKRKKKIPDNAFIKSKFKTKDNSIYEIAKSLDYFSLPFGEYKGASLAMMIEILSALLSDGNYGKKTETLTFNSFNGPSHFVFAIDPSKFLLNNFSNHLKKYKNDIINKNKSVRIPGMKSYLIEKHRKKYGIPLDANFEKKFLDY